MTGRTRPCATALNTRNGKSFGLPNRYCGFDPQPTKVGADQLKTRVIGAAHISQGRRVGYSRELAELRRKIGKHNPLRKEKVNRD